MFIRGWALITETTVPCHCDTSLLIFPLFLSVSSLLIPSIFVIVSLQAKSGRMQRGGSEDAAPRCSSSQSHRGSKAKHRHLDFEEALKEKDREIQNLRETMEKNEKVIVDVYNDKQRWWEEEMNTLMKDHNVSRRARASSPLFMPKSVQDLENDRSRRS